MLKFKLFESFFKYIFLTTCQSGSFDIEEKDSPVVVFFSKLRFFWNKEYYNTGLILQEGNCLHALNHRLGAPWNVPGNINISLGAYNEKQTCSAQERSSCIRPACNMAVFKNAHLRTWLLRRCTATVFFIFPNNLHIKTLIENICSCVLCTVFAHLLQWICMLDKLNCICFKLKITSTSLNNLFFFWDNTILVLSWVSELVNSWFVFVFLFLY